MVVQGGLGGLLLVLAELASRWQGLMDERGCGHLVYEPSGAELER